MATKITSKEGLIALGVFILLFYITFITVPYIQTRETYNDGNKINKLFPVAVVRDGQPAIVKWADYENNVTLYKDKLISNPLNEKHYLNESETFILRQDKKQRFNLELNEEDYVFWAQYKIESGVVKPISFRYNGVFAVFWGFTVAFIGTPILNWLRKRYIARH